MLALGCVVVACGGGPTAADERLCDEVARVAAELGARIEHDELETVEDRHQVAVGASHLLVAADGDRDGEPSTDLAASVRSAGKAGTSGALPDYVAALRGSAEACDDAGVSVDLPVLGGLDDA